MDSNFAVDSNTLIHCHRQVYPFEIAPAFWRQLVEKGGKRIIFLDLVKDEILSNNDKLSDWLRENDSYFVTKKAGETKIIRCYSEIITFVKSNQQYRETAKDEFARIADSWFCAYGKAYQDIIVTNKKYEPNIKRKVKIPNVCREFGIRYLGLLEFMLRLDVRFE